MNEKQAIWVRCLICATTPEPQRWIVAYLPMDLKTFAEVVGGARCPNCGAGGDKVVLSEKPAEVKSEGS